MATGRNSPPNLGQGRRQHGWSLRGELTGQPFARGGWAFGIRRLGALRV